MRSAGEVIRIDEHLGRAFTKTQIAAGQTLLIKTTVFLSVKDIDQPTEIEKAQEFLVLGFKTLATKGTATALSNEGLDAQRVDKTSEERQNVLEATLNEEVNLVIDTSQGAAKKFVV